MTPTELSAITIALISATSALVGAVIGALAVFLQTYLQQRYEHRRARARLAVEAALYEHGFYNELAKTLHKNAYLSPPHSFIYFYVRVFELIESNQLTTDALTKLAAEVDTLDLRTKYPKDSSPSQN